MSSLASEEATNSSVHVGYHSTLVSPVDMQIKRREESVAQPETESVQQPEEDLPTTGPDAAASSRLDSTIQQLSWQLLKNSTCKKQLADRLRQFANNWCGIVNADRVMVICLKKGRKPRVQAVSGTPSFDCTSASIHQLEQIADYSKSSCESLTWSASENSSDKDSMLGTYARLNGYLSAMMIPMLTREGALIGFVATFKNSGIVDQKKMEILSQELFPVLAENLSHAINAEQGRLFDFWRNAWKHLVIGKKIFWMIILSFVTGLMLLPVPYEVSCDSTLEPTFRRYVASPFEGKLKKSLVEPGTEVKLNQVLAVLDGDEFRLELASTEAEYLREKERHSAALQEGRVSDAQIAKLEMQKLQADINRLQQKITNLEVKSPIDGMIVSGDLKQSEGAPLEQGQTLFEVGPIDELNIEIEIPEAEVRFIKKNQPVIVRFHAFPLKEFKGKIDCVYPRAQTRNDKVVFVAKAKISNDEGLLRPGMKGNASIEVGDSLLGWNLFHRPVERLRSYMGW